jgi:nitrogen fixation protein FixH
MTRALTGRDVLLSLIAIFGLIFAVNTAFIVISVRTYRGEDEQKPYLQGVEYNHTLAERAKQSDLGWKASIGASRLANGKARIAVSLIQSNGTTEMHAVLSGELRHPADEHRDRQLTLHEMGAGEYRADIDGVTRGAWDVIVRGTGPQPFEASRRLWVP